jgi:hypothetical protein
MSRGDTSFAVAMLVLLIVVCIDEGRCTVRVDGHQVDGCSAPADADGGAPGASAGPSGGPRP